MTNRQRIINTVLCEKVDRFPFWFWFDFMKETIDRWEREGMDKEWNYDWHFRELPQGSQVFDEFGLDPGFVWTRINMGYCPAFWEEKLEDLGDKEIVRDEMGIKMLVNKASSSIPKYLEHPVKNRDDWNRLRKERLDPDDPARFPADWDTLVDYFNAGDRVVQLGDYPCGLFGTLRFMMGIENLMVSLYDQPDLIREMMGYLTDFWIAIYTKVCKLVKVDCIHLWEDMSGKGGPLISPGMIREFMMPNYKKIKSFADLHDIPIFSVDTDGNCRELIPLFLESGVNLVYPFEVNAGCDIWVYRKKYPRLCIMGGIDKLEIAKGRAAIDRELERIEPMFGQSGYIASLDHWVHPDISWEDFRYFTYRLKRRIMG